MGCRILESSFLSRRRPNKEVRTPALPPRACGTCRHIPTNFFTVHSLREEREVVRERDHNVAIVVREALDRVEERHGARHAGLGAEAHDAHHGLRTALSLSGRFSRDRVASSLADATERILRGLPRHAANREQLRAPRHRREGSTTRVSDAADAPRGR